MRVGVVAEIKPAEGRVGLTPNGVSALVRDGHEVFVESGAGAGAGFADDEYVGAGAHLASAQEAWGCVDLMVKVKEPVSHEYGYLRPNLTLFTYLHLAADRQLTGALLSSGTTAIAYETVMDRSGRLPLLAPMSAIAGRLAAQAAAQHLQSPFGGPGILMGGVAGVAPARVAIVGGGVVGTQAAVIAMGMQAEVTILDSSSARLNQLHELFGGRARIVMSSPESLKAELREADAVIGAVLQPGATAPKVLADDELVDLRLGSVLVDVAIDQGGCFATSHATTYEDPTYCVDGILHYCVANMPGAVPRTATQALTSVTLPYVLKIAGQGVTDALASDALLAGGLNIQSGAICHPSVASAWPDLAA